MTDDLAEALDAPHHSLADWLERQPVDDRNVGKVREIVRLLRSLPEAVEALREFDGNGPWITLASVTALLADADLPCQNPTVETWRIAGKPTVVPTDKRCGECANCALDMLRRGEQAEALADTLDEAVEALREKDRRIAKAISYANGHDYRGNRPRWMNDIPAILGGTDDSR